MLLDLCCKLGRSKRASGDVVDGLRERGGVGEVVDGALDAVGEVHHGEASVLGEEAVVVAGPDGVVENVDGVVSGSAAWRGICAQDAGVTSRPEVYTKLLSVVLFRWKLHGRGKRGREREMGKERKRLALDKGNQRETNTQNPLMNTRTKNKGDPYLAEELVVQLGNTVNSIGSHNRKIRGVVLGRRGAEGTNGRG